MSAKAVLLALALYALSNLSDACFSSGVCCGGCGGCVQPPPPVCGGGCGGGYGCGSYGCYQKARVASSKTLRIEKDGGSVESRERQMSPDEKFMRCCRQRQLPDACLNKCSYSTYTRDALQAMYFRMDACPMQAAADMQYCAAQGKDHTNCCLRNGITTTLAGQKCLTFCDQRPGNTTQLDLTYLPCYDRFENMKACFWQVATQGEQSSSLRRADPRQQSPESLWRSRSRAWWN